MFIKLDIQGELLDKLKEESETQFRSCTQQVMYIITKYYKEKESCTQANSTYYNETVSNDISYVQNTIENTSRQDATKIPEKVISYQEVSSYDDNTSSNAEVIESIDDDIVNF
ncbi:MAG: hypothetical protein IJ086_15945 [Clostridium sp.]|nr:hypothetical protein [Clostridium sp.]